MVSMFGGISDWVQNLEAASGEAVICHGSSQSVHLLLLPPEERAPILREYLRVASSGRRHFPLQVGAPLREFVTIAGKLSCLSHRTSPQYTGGEQGLNLLTSMADVTAVTENECAMRSNDPQTWQQACSY